MKNKNGKWFFRILGVFFAMYLVLLVAQKTGYYEKMVRDRTEMTEDKIKEFESDLANGEIIDLKDYLPEKEDYSNAFTKGANFISDKIGNILDSKADNVWDFIKSLFIG